MFCTTVVQHFCPNSQLIEITFIMPFYLFIIFRFTTKMATACFQVGPQFRKELVIIYLSLFIIALISSVTMVTNAQDSNPDPSSCSNLCDFNDWTKFANCSNRKLSSIPDVCSSAKTLQLNNNNIVHLNPDALQGFTSLRYLYLRSNTLSDISLNAFVGLEELEYLRLGGNCFTNLNGEILRGLDNLVFLLVVEGCLEHVAAETFKSLPNLGTLELGGNRLREPLCDAFGTGNVLQSLTLANNLIGSLPDYCFAELHLLRILSLDGNNLTEIRNGRGLSGLDNLQTLSLEETHLIRLSGNSFRNTTQLRHLSLARNGLANLPNDAFANLFNLTFLNLSNNALGRVSDKLFRSNLRLEIIDLSANRITQIDSGVLTGFQNLRTIKLSSNRITKISYLIQEIPWLDLVNLDNNPLRCECAILDFEDWLDRNAEYAAKCVFPPLSEYNDSGDNSLQNICEGHARINLTSTRSSSIDDSRLTEIRALSLPDATADIPASALVTTSHSQDDTDTDKLNMLNMTNTIVVAITIVLPLIFIVILVGIVYRCHKILTTAKGKSKNSITLSRGEDPRLGLIGARPPTRLTQFNGLDAVVASDEMGGIGDDEGLYEEFPEIESKINYPRLPKVSLLNLAKVSSTK